ncbi:MAG: DUF4825 domain-containing protein [Lachnospiraceae bacterium]|nr:DUF4825 domain-containing protein [Lachnospiraceae bacterium]
MSKIPCEIIKDLLPSYVDELTSEETGRAIEQHITECPSCRETLHSMKEQEIQLFSEEDQRELDFLKKTKKKNRVGMLLSLAVLLFMLLATLARNYLAAKKLPEETLDWDITVSGNNLELTVNTTSICGIQFLDVSEYQGFLKISVLGCDNTILYKSSRETTFTASEEIQMVSLGNQIIWAYGEDISPLTSRLCTAYNPFALNKETRESLLSILHLPGIGESMQEEIQTEENSYTWNIRFNSDCNPDRQKAFEERLRSCGYLMLAGIGNLDAVSFSYTVSGSEKSLTVTAADASAYAGEDIKTVGRDLLLLENLVQKTGFHTLADGFASRESDPKYNFLPFNDSIDSMMEFTVDNFAEDSLQSLQLVVSCDRAEASQAVTPAGGGSLRRGERLILQLIPEDFSEEIMDFSEAVITLVVTDSAGNTHPVQGSIAAEVHWEGGNYQLKLTGNAEDGYILKKR